jgi:beta-glucosidase
MTVAQLSEAAAPARSFPILVNQNGIPAERQVSVKTTDLKQIILDSLPEEVFITGDRGWKLKDVQEGKISLDTFVAQLSDDEMEAISRGGYTMHHPLGARGNAGIFGGVTESLRKKGIPVITTTDGPSGIRLYDSCSLIPIGTLLACTFDKALLEELFTKLGHEMRARGSDVLLAPGMNIHRNPLCGRNFEYFSEDPLVSGKIAAAIVRGIQSTGLSACPKHFACNNQEYNRWHNDSVVSQRALREIYLKGFEICVREGGAKSIMTSYNKINGVYAPNSHDLCTKVLRNEWGFKGVVMTDWFSTNKGQAGNAVCMKAGNDLIMPGGSYHKKALLQEIKDGVATEEDLRRCCANVLKSIFDSATQKEYIG